MGALCCFQSLQDYLYSAMMPGDEVGGRLFGNRFRLQRYAYFSIQGEKSYTGGGYMGAAQRPYRG